jgi:hypothetical protein
LEAKLEAQLERPWVTGWELQWGCASEMRSVGQWATWSACVLGSESGNVLVLESDSESVKPWAKE